MSFPLLVLRICSVDALESSREMGRMEVARHEGIITQDRSQQSNEHVAS